MSIFSLRLLRIWRFNTCKSKPSNGCCPHTADPLKTLSLSKCQCLQCVSFYVSFSFWDMSVVLVPHVIPKVHCRCHASVIPPVTVGIHNWQLAHLQLDTETGYWSKKFSPAGSLSVSEPGLVNDVAVILRYGPFTPWRCLRAHTSPSTHNLPLSNTFKRQIARMRLYLKLCL